MSIRNLSIAVIAKFVIEVIFMPNKFLNIYALAVATTICYLLVMLLNYFEIKEHFKINISYMFSAKLVFSNCVMVLSLVVIMSISKTAMNTILAFVVAIIVYFVCLFETKILNRTDKAMFKYKV